MAHRILRIVVLSLCGRSCHIKAFGRPRSLTISHHVFAETMTILVYVLMDLNGLLNVANGLYRAIS